jgi:hypothetical protein
LGGFVLFARGQQRAIILLQAAQAQFDTAVMEVFALAVAHPTFSRLGVGHSSFGLKGRHYGQNRADVNGESPHFQAFERVKTGVWAGIAGTRTAAFDDHSRA